MKKNLKVVSKALLLGALTAMIGGCSNEAVTYASGTIVDSYATYSSIKVCRNTDAINYYEHNKTDLKVDISMIKDESESAQLIFTSGKAISNYEIEVSDLKDAFGNVISKDDITIYVEQYVYLSKSFETSNGNFLPGDYIPDCLIPFKYIKNRKENKIPANSNQGFIVDVKSTAANEAGTYYGKIDFTFDGTLISVPVSVNIWDIEYGHKRTCQSTFWMYKNELIAYEYDDSQETIDAYFRMFNDFKVNIMDLDGCSPYMASKDGEEYYYMKDYVRYQCSLVDESNNYNTIPIPYVPIPNDYTFVASKDVQVVRYIYEFIKDLVYYSNNDTLYTDYAIFYMSNFDEFDINEERMKGAKTLYADHGEYYKLMEYIIQTLDDEGAFSKFTYANRLAIKDSIRNIVNVNAIVNYNPEVVGKLHLTYCPYISQFNDYVQAQKYYTAAQEVSNGNLWCYTCVGPKYPYPTFHMDDFNLGTRATGWIMRQNHINGYLYWSVNQSINFDGTCGGAYIDPYGEPWRTANCPGDGYLCYPGRKYGSSSPFPSLRLLNFRETMDDYDMIELFEDLVNEKSARYGEEIDSSSLLNDLYDSVFKGSNYFKEDSYVYKARKTLANRILALSSYDTLMAYPSYTDNREYVNVYSVNSSLNINGTSMNGEKCGSGYKYSVMFNKNQAADVEINGRSGTYNYSFSAGSVPDFFSQDSSFVMSDGSSFSYSNGISHFNIVSQYVNGGNADYFNGDTIRFKPSATYLGDDFKNLSTIDFTMKNTSNIPITVKVVAKTNKSDANIGSIYLEAGETRSVHFSALDTNANTRATFKGLSFVLDNVQSIGDGANAHYELYEDRSFDLLAFSYQTK